mgnify:CR=1 FL=1
MKKLKEMPLKLVKGGRGKYQADGESNHTLTQEQKVLAWLYERTIEGMTTSAWESFKANYDTSFRTHVSVLCRKHGLEIPREFVTNTATDSRHKCYWLSDVDLVKVRKILKT